MSSKKPKEVAILRMFDDNGQQLEELTVSIHDYYDGDVEAIDSSAVRKERGIRGLKGLLYNSKGKMFQEFENTYDGEGKLTRSQIRYDDGTSVDRTF